MRYCWGLSRFLYYVLCSPIYCIKKFVLESRIRLKMTLSLIFSMFPTMLRQGWHMLRALKHTYDLFLEKNCYCNISFGNVYTVYTYCCWCPSIYFVWLNFIWNCLLLEFEAMTKWKLFQNNPQADNLNNPHRAMCFKHQILLENDTFFIIHISNHNPKP